MNKQTICRLNIITAIVVMTSTSYSVQEKTSHDHHIVDGAPIIKTYGVKIQVPDMDKAIDFYSSIIGFEIESKNYYPQQVGLKTNDDIKLILNKVENRRQENLNNEAGISFTLQVNNIDSTHARLKAKGVSFIRDEKQQEGVGYSLHFRDPFGNTLALLEQTIVKVPSFPEPKIYNFGFYVPDIGVQEKFMCDNLGSVVRSKKYLPRDLPLGHKDGTFAFMLHLKDAPREWVGSKKINHPDAAKQSFVVMFQTDDLDAAIQHLKTQGVNVLHSKPQDSPQGRYIAFADPFGLVSELIEPIHQEKVGSNSNGSTNMPELARAAYDRFKKIEGQWLGRSTKGWEEVVSFKTIAQGAVVVENSFDAHPNETMMTMFYLDGERLMLTHYCVAGNQPRLEATSFENDGKTITFTFLDATNLPSRDKGHMDKAVVRFIDDNKFSTQWTWYQNGKESWMEEIVCERKR